MLEDPHLVVLGKASPISAQIEQVRTELSYIKGFERGWSEGVR